MQHIGIDIIEIARISEAIDRWGEGFLKRVYTDAELPLYRDKLSSLAARFAAKEAVIKALGIVQGVNWKDIEILSGPDGQPLVTLHGKMHDRAVELGMDNLAVSLSHCKDYAVAIATAEKATKA